MNTYLIAIGLAMALALGGLGVLLKRAYTNNGLLSAQVGELTKEAQASAEARKRDQAVLARRIKAAAAAARETALLRVELSQAVANNRAWADAPVPKEVQDALSK